MSPRAERSVLKRNQPESPSSQHDHKKPRRSQRIQGKAEEGPSTPATDVNTAPSPASSRNADQRTPASSPGPGPEPTQVASQFYCPPPPDDEIASQPDPNVWGYLVPLNPSSNSNRRTIKLDKEPGGGNSDSRSGSRGRNKRKSGVSGFLIGRHPECDMIIESAVISNRHCVIYKEVTSKKPRAILEDLSSNGTWINGVVVGRNNRRELRSGDEIEFAGHSQFVFRYPEGMVASQFRDTYELGRPLGSGHFATVYTAIEKKTGIPYAVKVFTKRKSEEKSKSLGLQQEIAVLMSVSHPNVLCLKGTFDEDDGVYLVLELAPEGELFNYIINHQKLTEEETRVIFKQLFNGLKYLHDRNIVHRDIKPENILLVDKQLTVKLADFGLAKIIGEESFTTSLCGTPSYVAPEILKSTKERKYDRAVDIWSLGVVLYICLCGFPPFSDELCTRENPYNLAEQIKRGIYDFPSPYWDSVGDAALDLIEHMLEVHSKRRYTVDDCLRHPWLTNGYFNPADSASSITNALENIGFQRKYVEQQRTLLAEAPGLANSTLPNPSRAVPQSPRQYNNGAVAGPSRAAAAVAGPSSPLAKGSSPKRGKDKLDANTKAFVNIGGKAGNETLYGDEDYEGSAEREDDT